MERPAFDAPASEWLVYGDALQESGDPRGELIGLVHGVREGKTGAGVLGAYVRRHGKALFGFDPGDTFDCDWHYGMIRGLTVRLRVGQPDPLARLFAMDLASELRELTLIGIAGSRQLDLAPAMAIAREHAPKTCTVFRFVDDRARKASMLSSRDFDPDANLVQFGSFAPFLEVADELAVECADSHQLDFGEFDAKRLRAFSLKSLRLAGYEDLETMGDRLADAQFANLTSFELRLVEQFMANIPIENNVYVEHYGDNRRRDEAEEGDCEGVDWGELARLFATLATCPLERLALTSFVSGASLMEALRSVAWPTSLTTLDLSDSALADDDLAQLPEIEHLVILRTAVTDAAAERLRARGLSVEHSTSATAPSYRYVVGAE